MRGQQREEGEAVTEAEVGVTCTEGGGGGGGGAMSQGTPAPWEAGGGQEADSPLQVPEGTQPCRNLDLSSVRPTLDF